MAGVFSILFVCTGNLCRSPMAERFAAYELARRLGPAATSVPVSSAGTRARGGRGMSSNAAVVLAAGGADPAGFASRELTTDLVRDADLILTAERAHRGQVVTLEPAALRRSFTLVEFARTATATATAATAATAAKGAAAATGSAASLVDHARAVVATTARCRGTVPAARPDDDDLADPIGHPLEVYQDSGARIRQAVGAALDALLPSGPRLE